MAVSEALRRKRRENLRRAVVRSTMGKGGAATRQRIAGAGGLERATEELGKAGIKVPGKPGQGTLESPKAQVPLAPGKQGKPVRLTPQPGGKPNVKPMENVDQSGSVMRAIRRKPQPRLGRSRSGRRRGRYVVG